MLCLMLIHRCQVSNNYWKIDYGKQKRTVTIFANAKDRPCYLRGRDRGLLYQPSEIVVEVTHQNRFAHRRHEDYSIAG